MQAGDLDDPQRLAFLRWASVFSQWLDGDPAPMAAWLADPAVQLPDNARYFLSDLVLGRVKRPRGRRPNRSAKVERAVLAEVFNERRCQADKPRVTNPLERAIGAVAKRRVMSAGTVRGIVEKLADSGITFEAWESWGRPTWTA